MTNLTPLQKKAYIEYKNLEEVRRLSEKRAKKVFKLATGREQIPLFSDLSDEEAEEILEALSSQNLYAILQDAGRESGVCQICGRVLTDPASVARGIGPECAKNFSERVNLDEFLT